MTIKRYESPSGMPFSRIVRAGGFVFFSGQIPMTREGKVAHGDIKEQTRMVCERLQDNLTEASLDFSDVIKVTVWLSDINMFNEFNEVYREYFTQDLPTRSTVESKLALGVDVEIEIMALDR